MIHDDLLPYLEYVFIYIYICVCDACSFESVNKVSVALASLYGRGSIHHNTHANPLPENGFSKAKSGFSNNFL